MMAMFCHALRTPFLAGLITAFGSLAMAAEVPVGTVISAANLDQL